MTRAEVPPLWVPRRPYWVLVMVTVAVTALSPVFAVLGTPTITPGSVPIIPLLLGLALLALQLRHSLAAARGERLRGGSWTLLVMAGLVYAPLPWFTYNWLATQGLMMASALMVLRGRATVAAAAAAPALVTAVYVPVHVALSGRPSALYLIWDGGFWMLSLPMLAVVLYAAAWLTRTAGEFRSTKAELAELAVGRERLRLSRDLHDLLGQSLSAVSLKSDLAIRLLPSDRAAARREIESLTLVARDALHGVRAVTRNTLLIDLQTELAAAARLLAAAKISVQIETDTSGLNRDAEHVLAWAVREGATNVLRHSSATWCSISIRHDARNVILQIRNDGVAGAAGTGTGLTGLADRAAAAAGQMTAGPAPGGCFGLTVEIPLEAP